MKGVAEWLPRIAAALLVGAVVADPDSIGDGFKILRWIVTAAAVVQGWALFREPESRLRNFKIGALAVVAITFNPFDPLHFERETWVWIDFVTAAAFLAFDSEICERLKNHRRKIAGILIFSSIAGVVISALVEVENSRRQRESQREQEISEMAKRAREADEARIADEERMAAAEKLAAEEEERAFMARVRKAQPAPLSDEELAARHQQDLRKYQQQN